MNEEGAFAKIVRWYDGYRFEENAERVINPVSFGLCAEDGKFQNYWANTATPTFLIDALKVQPLDFSSKYDFAGKKVTKLGLSFSSEKRTVVGMAVA